MPVRCLNVCGLSSESAYYTNRLLMLLRVVKESGLVCVSYGIKNDDKEFVRRQIDAGVDAVIVVCIDRIDIGI